MLPNTAIPTALPSERVNMLAPVATPRRFHPTTDCTATMTAVEANPIPMPVTKLAMVTGHSPESAWTVVA